MVAVSEFLSWLLPFRWLAIFAAVLVTIWLGALLREIILWRSMVWPWGLSIYGMNPITSDERGVRRDLYMKRWMLLPSNRYFNIYLHHFIRGDSWMHDHPYHFVAFAFRGTGFERLDDTRRRMQIFRRVTKVPRFYRSDVRHAITEAAGLWTLVVRGPEHRVWGMVIPRKNPMRISELVKWVDYRVVTRQSRHFGWASSWIADSWYGWQHGAPDQSHAPPPRLSESA